MIHDTKLEKEDYKLIIKKANYEDALFYYKHEYNWKDSDKLNKIVDSLYVVEVDEEHGNIIYSLNNKSKDKSYIFKATMDLVHHCRMHNKYDAKLYLRVVHAYGKAHSQIIADKIIEINDDECLRLLLDFIADLSMQIPVLQDSPYVICLIVDYFINDYKNEQSKKIYEEISDNFRNYKDNDLSFKTLERIFSKYDEEISFNSQVNLNGFELPFTTRNDEDVYELIKKKCKNNSLK